MSGRSRPWAIVVAAGSGERLGADRPKAFVRVRRAHAAGRVARDVRGARRASTASSSRCRRAGRPTSACSPTTSAPARSRPPSPAARRAPIGRERARRACPTRRTSCSCTTRPGRWSTPRSSTASCTGLAEGADGVVPALPVTDTVKRLAADGAVAETFDRAALRAVQTPQGFPVERLRAAIERAGDALAAATDCASLVEARRRPRDLRRGRPAQPQGHHRGRPAARGRSWPV